MGLARCVRRGELSLLSLAGSSSRFGCARAVFLLLLEYTFFICWYLLQVRVFDSPVSGQAIRYFPAADAAAGTTAPNLLSGN
jgi:hypothetical protein